MEGRPALGGPAADAADATGGVERLHVCQVCSSGQTLKLVLVCVSMMSLVGDPASAHLAIMIRCDGRILLSFRSKLLASR